jgi:stage II sporulation protein D
MIGESMAEPSRRPDQRRRPGLPDERVVRGPVVILPPARPGGPERRFAIQPGKVFSLLILCFLLGAGAAVVVLQLLTTKKVDDLSVKVETLELELDRLRSTLPAAAGTTDAEPATAGGGEEPTAAGAEELGPKLDIPLASLGPEEPRVRVALLRTTEEIVLEGEGIVLAHERGEPTPMPRNRALIRPGVGGGIFIEGVGPVRQGTRVESVLGPIRIGDREYPGKLEVHSSNGTILLINEVAMEVYVAGVVSSEMPASWGLEAKKAQAIAARSYALMRRGATDKPYHLEASVLDQVYSGKPVDGASQAAVTATHGQVLGQDGGLVSVYYSSTCAGRTEHPHNVWPDRPSHGVSHTSCGYCEASPTYSWTASILPAEVLRALEQQGVRAKEIHHLELRTSTTSGRVASIDVVTDGETVTWSGNDFRRFMGWGRVRSTRFELRYEQDAFVLTGTGFGHGVGLCQWGANGMDRAGLDYRAILGRYFPGGEVVEVY